MPLVVPTLDDRRYQDLLDEALARIPVHNPEWTNFNKSDPGVTLLELFAFLTESLLYRVNLIPERNRLKFLSLLGLPLHPGSSAQGLITLTNARGLLRTITLNADLQVEAGQVPFRTTLGLDVLPIEAQVYIKRKVSEPDPQVLEYYRQLYASYQGMQAISPVEPMLYASEPLPMNSPTTVNVSAETTDHAVWIALLARSADVSRMDEVRKAIATRVLSLGVVPITEEPARTLDPGGSITPESGNLLTYAMPKIPPDGRLPDISTGQRVPRYQTVNAVPTTDVLAEPGIVQITLPDVDQLQRWSNLDPLETGVGAFPPSLEDTRLDERLITWLRISIVGSAPARFLWLGINATTVTQRARVSNERLPDGTGRPDQVVVLANTPVVPGSPTLTVTPPNAKPETWEIVDDLLSAGPEVPVPNLRLPPGSPPPQARPAKVAQLDPESGAIHFGDGMRGARPPFQATLRASYDYGVGQAGNVGPGSINSGPSLPDGIKVSNPVSTWGGTDPESIAQGEKLITRYLQNRDRLVNVDDFTAITLRTPGVEIGRVDVLPAFNPRLSVSEPGDAPGAVTLMVLPAYDPVHPASPEPDQAFINAICAYLDPRRLVTTEVFLRGPVYQDIWVSVGINTIAGASIAQVVKDVKAAITRFLSPLPVDASLVLDDQRTLFTEPTYSDMHQGWPLRQAVQRLELLAVANRVSGVQMVNGVFLFDADGNPQETITMTGLQLPRLAGIAVGVGNPVDVDQIPGFGEPLPEPTQPTPPAFVPVPVVPEECE